jgi:hypothetical protein
VGVGWQLLWIGTGVATIVASLFAYRSKTARYVARVALFVLFVLSAALLHVINLASGADYAGFADPAHFAWVTESWRAVVAPNQPLFIGLLAVFEAAVGVLILSGGRRTQVGLVAAIAFHLALWIFGWFETVWCVVMIPALLLLLRAERHAEAVSRAAPAVEGGPQ